MKNFFSSALAAIAITVGWLLSQFVYSLAPQFGLSGPLQALPSAVITVLAAVIWFRIESQRSSAKEPVKAVAGGGGGPAPRQSSSGPPPRKPNPWDDVLIAFAIGSAAFPVAMFFVLMLAKATLKTVLLIAIGILATGYCFYRWKRYPAEYAGVDAKFMNFLTVVGGAVGLAAAFT